MIIQNKLITKKGFIIRSISLDDCNEKYVNWLNDKKYGAKVPFLRSEKNSDDYATTADVIEEVLLQYETLGIEYDNVCCIYPTAPFINAERLSDAMTQFINSGKQSLLPVVRFSFPPQRGMVIREGNVQYLYPEHEKTRSQDLEAIYHDCGQFYICKCKDFKVHKSLVMPNSMPFFIEEVEV